MDFGWRMPETGWWTEEDIGRVPNQAVILSESEGSL
jgi:hypothetical protein